MNQENQQYNIKHRKTSRKDLQNCLSKRKLSYYRANIEQKKTSFYQKFDVKNANYWPFSVLRKFTLNCVNFRHFT